MDDSFEDEEDEAFENFDKSFVDSAFSGKRAKLTIMFQVLKLWGLHLLDKTPSRFVSALAIEDMSNREDVICEDVSPSSADLIDTIEVEGCGISSFNGTYNSVSVRVNGYQCFTRRYKYEHEWVSTLNRDEVYVIFHKSTYWCIGQWHGGDVSTGTGRPGSERYRTMSSTMAQLPPKNGWMTVPGGSASDAPKLKW